MTGRARAAEEEVATWSWECPHRRPEHSSPACSSAFLSRRFPAARMMQSRSLISHPGGGKHSSPLRGMRQGSVQQVLSTFKETWCLQSGWSLTQTAQH